MNSVTPSAAMIAIERLAVNGPQGEVIVHPWSAEVGSGETLALIGESGSGKTLSAKALIGLLAPGLSASGALLVNGTRYPLAQAEGDWQPLRGRLVTMVLQDPFTALSPVHRIGEQIGWTIDAHVGKLSGRQRTDRIRAALEEVRLPAETAEQYPHQLSGGMRQRAAIAAALASQPQLVIADEPTTALDASNQAGILELLDRLGRERGIAVLLITHDLGVVRDYADRVLVMRQGEIVERGSASELFTTPKHEYTRSLLAADPVTAMRNGDLVGAAGAADAAETPVLRASGVTKSFAGRPVLRGVDFEVRGGEIVGLVGESGSGKSTLMRCIAGLELEDAGRIEFDGVPVRPGRRDRTPEMAQIVFQDPYSSLNPMFTVGDTLREALRVANRPASDASELLEQVGLSADYLRRRPASLSGGQRQRVAIARALAPRPKLLICDESVSALDVSVQAKILELLRRLRDETGQAIALISHDLGVVLAVTDRVAVLRDGVVVESGRSAEVFGNPQHDYTKQLVSAALGRQSRDDGDLEVKEP